MGLGCKQHHGLKPPRVKSISGLTKISIKALSVDNTVYGNTDQYKKRIDDIKFGL